MHFKFTSFGTYYIFYIRRGRSYYLFTVSPSYITFKHVKEKGYEYDSFGLLGVNKKGIQSVIQG